MNLYKINFASDYPAKLLGASATSFYCGTMQLVAPNVVFLLVDFFHNSQVPFSSEVLQVHGIFLWLKFQEFFPKQLIFLFTFFRIVSIFENT